MGLQPGSLPLAIRVFHQVHYHLAAWTVFLLLLNLKCGFLWTPESRGLMQPEILRSSFRRAREPPAHSPGQSKAGLDKIMAVDHHHPRQGRPNTAQITRKASCLMYSWSLTNFPKRPEQLLKHHRDWYPLTVIVLNHRVWGLSVRQRD